MHAQKSAWWASLLIGLVLLANLGWGRYALGCFCVKTGEFFSGASAQTPLCCQKGSAKCATTGEENPRESGCCKQLSISSLNELWAGDTALDLGWLGLSPDARALVKRTQPIFYQQNRAPIPHRIRLLPYPQPPPRAGGKSLLVRIQRYRC